MKMTLLNKYDVEKFNNPLYIYIKKDIVLMNYIIGRY
jgi:hypothetical protein